MSEVSKRIIQRWGTDEQYYAELEEFYRRHKGDKAADRLVVPIGENFPVCAIYYFRPFTVIADEFSLMAKLRHAIEGGRNGEAVCLIQEMSKYLGVEKEYENSYE